MSIKIAIADDHHMIVEGLTKMLSPYRQIECGQSYGTGADLLRGLETQQPDVLLLDIHFPDTTGNELMCSIKPLYPELKILVLTSIEDPYTVRDMMQKGCLGYVQKSIASAVLVQAIETVYYGHKFLDPALKEAMAQTVLHTGRPNPRDLQFSERERQILELICEGYTSIEIGKKLFLSHRTIENLRVALFQKLEVSNMANLVKVAIKQGLVRL